MSDSLSLGGPTTPDSAVRRTELGRLGINIGKALLNAILVLVIVVLLWVLALKAFHVTSYVGKGPKDVWDFMFTGDDAAANRKAVFSPLGRTLVDSSIGFVAGMVTAIVLAGAIVLSKGAESAIMPIAMIFRSVPLIALAPVVILIFGRGVFVIAVMSGIVVLFPALVNIVFGLRATSQQMRDVVHVYGGNDWDALRRVAFPSALPALFASIRISVPGSITGALIAEWLATGHGIGYVVVSAAGQAQNNLVWALVTVITVVSLLLYTLAQVVESFVLARYGTNAGRG